MNICQKFLALFLLSLPGYHAMAQLGNTTTDGRTGSRALITGVPFLLIAPDSRSGAMGDAGVAISADANAMHWNPSKLSFADESNTGFSVSYSPWLQRLIPDIKLLYLSGYHHFDEQNTVGFSLRYFSLGQIQLIDAGQNEQGIYNPNEFAVDGSYSRKFGQNFSLGSALRFIYSNLANGQFNSGQQTRPATTLAVDVSAFYKLPTPDGGEFAAGLNISNIGGKLSYVEGGSALFLPTNLKIGVAKTFKPDELTDFTIALDINKLLVPTPPQTVYDVNSGQYVITKGRNPSNLSVPAAIFGSFTDAPDGLKEELQEISYSGGAELWYNQQFALRAGYFYENPMKGNRQYFTFGAGFRYNVVHMDLSYLLANQQKSPMANTLRFSLGFNFGPVTKNKMNEN